MCSGVDDADSKCTHTGHWVLRNWVGRFSFQVAEGTVVKYSPDGYSYRGSTCMRMLGNRREVF